VREREREKEKESRAIRCDVSMNCRLAATSTEGIIKFYNARSVVALRAELKSRCVKRLSFFHCVLPRGTAAVIKRGARRVDGRGPSNKRIGMSKAFDMGIRRRARKRSDRFVFRSQTSAVSVRIVYLD
jgi:hypothetical protein